MQSGAFDRREKKEHGKKSETIRKDDGKKAENQESPGENRKRGETQKTASDKSHERATAF